MVFCGRLPVAGSHTGAGIARTGSKLANSIVGQQREKYFFSRRMHTYDQQPALLHAAQIPVCNFTGMEFSAFSIYFNHCLLDIEGQHRQRCSLYADAEQVNRHQVLDLGIDH